MVEQTANQALPITTGSNFRELGGYESQSGQHVKYHKLVRSGLLGELNSRDLTYLSDYGVRQDIDFRSNDEVTQTPDKVPARATYHYLPVFDYDQTQNSQSMHELEIEYRDNPNSGHERMLKVYHNLIADPHAKKVYHDFFATLLANTEDNEAVLFHCTAGKDRTGMGAVFLLTALGVDRETIKADYLLTNTIAAPHIEHRLAELKSLNAHQNVVTNIQSLLTVHPDYLATALAEIKREAGDLKNYLHTDLGLSDHDIKELQQIYLV
ncbi:tyrosine-protein phosphatase [Loigolactobacillus iwatensis]|uniref:tyrosine-protein phosphatase n=1 Tax=Loigolactobacillus iwatensis TaxID=1267156 RepID=UPI000F7D93DD|nr:tyrosine-protein phosphatase [Loigolactobacillus iwatensis]